MGTSEDIKSLNRLNYDKLQGTNEEIKIELNNLADEFNWHNVIDDIPVWLYKNLSSYPPMQELIKLCSGKGVEFSEIASKVFTTNNKNDAEAATEILLLLGTMAKSEQDRVLLPSRVHLMFKGLNGIFACLNPNCSHHHEVMSIRLGKIYENFEKFECDCGSRVFELICDRRCGTIFIRAYKDDSDSNKFIFLWQEQSNLIYEPKEIHLWLTPKGRTDVFKNDVKRSKAKENSIFGYIDSNTGILFYDEHYENRQGFIKVLIPIVFGY